MKTGIISNTFLAFLFSFQAFRSDVNCLYDANTDRGLYVLTEESFNATVYSSLSPTRSPITGNNLWIVQFYNSWCGHCIKFSQIYKAVANQTQYWSTHLKLGSVNCADDLNRDLCSRLNIQQTPLLKIFPPRSSSSKQQREDVEVSQSTVDQLHTVLDAMEFHHTPAELVPLPVQGVNAVWASLPRSVNEVAVIVEPIGSYIGKETIMHALPNLHAIAVRRAYSNNHALLESLHVNEQSSFVMFLDRSHPDQKGVVTLESLPRNADPIAAFISAILRADTELTTRLRVQRRHQMRQVYGGITSFSVFRPPRPQRLRMQSEQASSFTLSVQTSVSLQDLNSAVLYSLGNEIGRHSEITGLEYDTLKIYIDALIKWVTVKPETLTALRNIGAILSHRSDITGSEILSLLRKSGLSVDSRSLEWDNCKGSVPDRRGYPCGLWQVIHVMSVKAYEASLLRRDESNSNALASDGVLTTVIGYVDHFFSCGECSRNFMQGVSNLRRNNVAVSNADAVLFLWRAHNNANRFLAGDFSEDPAYPKRQFPALVQCFDCRRTTDPAAHVIVWNETNVLRFLREFYGLKNNAADSVASFVIK